MDQETKLLLDAFEMYKKELSIAFCTDLSNAKNSKVSEEIRKEGNVQFVEKIHNDELHKEILTRYNASSAFAPNGSYELALAYANKSAFLLHIEKYQECIQDVEKALEIAESNELKIKLLCRKVECLKKLGTTCENTLDKAQSLVVQIDQDDKKQKFNDMITKVSLLTAEKADVSQKTNELVDVPVTDDLLERVSIRHNEKYGRHLVAKQDYLPGDIIFVQKLFSTTVEPPNRYVNCHHCLKDCWTSVPCHHCYWVIFCSEECRQEAWKEYHDIECSIGTLLNDVLDFHTWNPCSLSIKILLRSLKDAGSINNLKARLTAVDQNTDLCTKGFYKDGRLITNTIENFCSLTKRKFSSEEENLVLRVALLTLIGLLKHPQWRDIFSLNELNDLMQNQDMVYLGSLLIKFAAIESNNGLAVVHFQSIYDAYKYRTSAAPRGCCISTLASLINTSCCANASRCFTENGNIILYAVKPIEKHSQIFITYAQEFYSFSLTERKPYLNRYDVECDCRACTESWPALLDQLFGSGDLYYTPNADEGKFLKKCRDVYTAMFEEDYSKATLEKLIPKIILAFECLEQPSTFMCLMQETLSKCITNVYNGLPPQTFGKCKKM